MYEFLFIIFSVLINVSIIFFSLKIMKSDNGNKNHLVLPMVFAFAAVFFYAIFLLCQWKGSAMLFNSLYYASMDWISIAMLNFSNVYTETFRKLKKVNCFLCAFAAMDSVSLIVNVFTLHSYDLVLAHNGSFSYWKAIFTPIHSIHLGFCYVVLLFAFILLINRMVKVSSYYKAKYLSIVIAFLAVLFADFASYTMQMPIDFALLLYPVLAGFINYYTCYSFPHNLVAKSLISLNETLVEGIFYFDIEKKLQYKNKAGIQIFPSDFEAELYFKKWLVNKKKTDVFNFGGTDHHFLIEYNLLAGKQISGSFLKFIDKTEELTKLAHEKYVLTHDELTGIYNRAGFFEAVDNMMIESAGIPRYLLCSSIKDFELVNEVLGEKAAEDILRRVSTTVQKFCHADSVFGHISEDKFALFMKKEFFREELFLEHLGKIQRVNTGATFRPRIFIGVYETQGVFESAQSMYDKALLAVDTISSDYKKLFSFYDANLMDRLLAEKNIINEFEQGLENGNFQMNLQPQLGYDGTLYRAEALVRWNHPTRGVIPPQIFIGVLERAGLIYKMDLFIWEEAVKFISNQTAALNGKKEVSLSVNVSVKDFFFLDVFETLKGLVEKYGVRPENLMLEISEAALMTDFSKVMESFKKLQAYGFKIEIDDFGSDYSSLNVLKDINADILKIDIDFLRKAENEERGRIILSSMIEMAKNLNMQVLTEGVEEREQVELLRELGCNVFQGFYFSKPLSPEEYSARYLD